MKAPTVFFAAFRSETGFRRPTREAFSLVEMLTVMAIVAIIVAITAPMVMSAVGAYQLDSAGQILTSQLTLARQQARSGNHAVEVWFYQLPDYSQATNATPSIWRGMQAFSEGDPPATGNPTLTALSRPFFFPNPVTLSQTTSPNVVSPFLTNWCGASTNTTAPSLPGYGQNYNYIVFRFRPDGSTDLTANNNSFTVVLENAKVITNGLPNNYETIQIDPVIGSVRGYRP